jgi:polyisoprenyl-phosphate glycosyltransferase
MIPVRMESQAGGTPPKARTLELLSVVAPVYNEEATITVFVRRVREALGDMPYELLLVDDGSTDRTGELLERLENEDEHVRTIRLSRNFGHQAALTAGLDQAAGNAIVMLDSDLQDPPELIGELIGRWSEGADVVYAVRRQRDGEGRFKLGTARVFYRAFSKLAQIDLEPNSGDFRLLDRRALDALGSMRERNRFLRGMTVWVGFTQTAVAYDRDARYAGETKFTLRRMFRFAFDAISSFSHVPLQAATALGFLFSLIAFLGMPVAVAFKATGQFVPGITTVLFAVLLLGGIQLITVGIIGEYIGRIYEEVKGRPLYVLRDGPAPDPMGGVSRADAASTQDPRP